MEYGVGDRMWGSGARGLEFGGLGVCMGISIETEAGKVSQ